MTPLIMDNRPLAVAVSLAMSLMAVLSACSLFEGEPYPQAQPAFFLRTQPPPTCDPLECAWSNEAALIAKADSSFGFGEGLTELVYLTLPDRTLSLFGSGLRAADLDLTTGEEYRFESEAVLYGLLFPNPVALRVSDTAGLALYAASTAALPGTDTTGMGIDELLLLPEGWSIRIEEADFGSGRVFCAQETPFRVVVENEGTQVRLVQGERGRLGPFDVQVRAARRLLYDGSCIDGYAHEFSIVIARRAIA